MTRKQALLAILMMPMGTFNVANVRAQSGGGLAILTIPLDQWAGLNITYKGKTLHYSATEVFRILGEKEK